MQKFEKQPGETARAYAAFVEYLNLGAERSLAALARDKKMCKVTLERWSVQWKWVARIAEYDARMVAVLRETAENLRKEKAVDWFRRDLELREQEWETREELVALGKLAIARFHANPARCGSLEGIARVLDLASILGHRAAGTPTERIEVTGAGGGPVRVEFKEALDKVYGPIIDVEPGK